MRWQRNFRRYQAGFTITLVAVPGIMIAVTFICSMFYLHPYTHESNPSSPPIHPPTIMGSIISVSLGIIAGGLGWIISAVGAQMFAAIDRANPPLYRELRSRFEALQPHITAALKFNSIWLWCINTRNQLNLLRFSI
jgi:hypothetical protein